MKLKVHAGSEPDSFLPEQDFRIVPKLFLLCMMPDAFRHIPLFTIGITTTVFIFRLIRKSQVDGVAAPWAGVLIKGRNRMSVSGSNQACIVIMFVLTIPGSDAFMVMPLS